MHHLDRLRILFVSPFPPRPAQFGAQRRVEGLLKMIARRHEVTAVVLVPPYIELGEAERGIRELDAEPVVIRSHPVGGLDKRLRQLRSLASPSSFERRHHARPELRLALERLGSERRFDVVNAEFPFFDPHALRIAPGGEPRPRLVLDEHNVEFELVRQMTGLEQGLGRHIHNSINWRKLRREEVHAWRSCDGVMFTSQPDADRAGALVPSIRSRVVPNAADVEYFRPASGHAAGDGQTVLFFGTCGYFPNHDGVLYFLREIWPHLSRSHPRARFKLIGGGTTSEIRAFEGPRVELAGQVDDIRPHLASAAVSVVPLRIGGGTRLKILEAMAMGKPIVSTRLGAEGIAATPERHLLLADDPAGFAAAVGRVLDDRELAGRLGAAARVLAQERYSWEAAGEIVDAFYRELLEPPIAAAG